MTRKYRIQSKHENRNSDGRLSVLVNTISLDKEPMGNFAFPVTTEEEDQFPIGAELEVTIRMGAE